MAKIVLPDASNGNSGTQRINDNFRKVAEALNDKVLFRDNPPGEPNEMNNDLDMNSNRVYNLPIPTLDHEAAPWGEVKGGVPAAKEYAEQARLSAIAAAVSAALAAVGANTATQQANRAESEADRAEEAADRAEEARNIIRLPYPEEGVDPFPKFKEILEDLPDGANVVIPPGHYITPYRGVLDPNNFINITASGVSISAVPGSVILENFLFYVHGTVSAPQIVGAAGFTSGSKEINTATAHGLVSGDYVQTFSSVNAGSTDAGEFQMESTNPDNLTPGNLRLTEIHRVLSAPTPLTATLETPIVYPGYKDNIAGYSFPIPGVTGAQIRKITPLKRITFSGITFKNTENNSFRGVFCRYVVDFSVVDCDVIATGRPGNFFSWASCKGIRLERVREYRSPEGAGGSGWNSFLPGGGCSDIMITDCQFMGGQQSVDFTPRLFPSEPDSSYDAAVGGDQFTVQNMQVIGCRLYGCVNGITTHPGCYNFIATGNIANGCNTGLLLRSTKNTVTDNTLSCISSCVSFSGFYDETLVDGNNLSDFAPTSSWYGVAFTPMSSEVMNQNNLKNVVVSSNTMQGKFATIRVAMRFRHLGAGVPPEGFTEFTDAIKTALSNYTVKDNVIRNCYITLTRYISGVKFLDNTFSGATGIDHYLVLDGGSSAAYVSGNRFIDDGANAIYVGTGSGLTFPFDSRHTFGNNYGIGSLTTIMTPSNATYESILKPLSTASELNTIPTLDSGVWTPTFISGANTAQGNSYSCMYTRVGNNVSVAGQIRVTPTASGVSTSFILTLPIASDFTSGNDAGGTFSPSTAEASGYITANTSGDNLSFSYTPLTTTQTVFKFSGSYIVK